MKRKILAAVIASTLLAGCNDNVVSNTPNSGDNVVSDSNDSSSTGDIDVKKGQLIDAAVANVSYKTETQQGVTDKDGNYDYLEGETVTFSIGAIEFPPVNATGVITPIELAGKNTVDDAEVVNIARFLQTLDSDGNPSNGISISEDAIQAATVNIDFDVTEDEFENNAEVDALVSQYGSNGGTLVSKNDALAHFESTLTSNGIDYGKFVGTWIQSPEVCDGPRGENENELLMFSFFPDGTYMHFEVDLDPENAENPNEIPGMEWGKFDIVNEGGKDYFISTETYADGNGDTGLTDVVLKSQLEDSPYAAAVEFSYPDSNTITLSALEGSDEKANCFTTLKKISTDGFQGTWVEESSTSSDPNNTDKVITSITFFSDPSSSKDLMIFSESMLSFVNGEISTSSVDMSWYEYELTNERQQGESVEFLMWVNHLPMPMVKEDGIEDISSRKIIGPEAMLFDTVNNELVHDGYGYTFEFERP